MATEGRRVTAPELAHAWHRECAACGIVLTIRLETEDGVPQSVPQPNAVPCDLCKAPEPGPWVEGEYPDDEAEQ